MAIFETVSMAATAKVKACHHPLQVLDVAVQVYPALQWMQAKVLPKNFEDENFADENFVDGQLTAKPTKSSLKNLYVYGNVK